MPIALPHVPARLLLAPYQSADWILDKLDRAGRLALLTKGHLSLLDLVHAAIRKTGPARVLLCVWGASWEELSKLAALRKDGTITALHLMLPHAGDKHREDVARVTELFPGDVVTESATHAKLAVIEGGDWAIVVRGSMNLYACSHAEQLDIDDSPAIAAEARAYAAQPQERARYPKPIEEQARAGAALAGLQPGGRVFGLTDGYSLPALLRAALEITGPARVSVVTARLGKKEAHELATMPAATSVRVVLGQSVTALAKDAALVALTTLGAERLRVALTHAKIVTIRNDRWHLTIRSSMNLCANLRAEQFDVSDDATIADQADAWIDFLFAETPAGISTANSTLGAIYRRSLADDSHHEAAEAKGRWARKPEPINLTTLRAGPSPARFSAEHAPPPFQKSEATTAAIDLARFTTQPLPFDRRA